MKLIKKVSAREVKRAFIVPHFIQIQKGNKRYLGKISPEQYETRLSQAKKKGLALRPKQLDKVVGEWPRRIEGYNASDWYLTEVKTSEVGVWKKAGGLPTSWTNCSLKKTADKVLHALKNNPKILTKRARRTIPNMLATNVKKLQDEKYLLPIIFKGGTGTLGRKGLKYKTRGDIDDGNMRAITLAVSGVKTIRAYFGVPKKKRD